MKKKRPIRRTPPRYDAARLLAAGVTKASNHMRRLETISVWHHNADINVRKIGEELDAMIKRRDELAAEIKKVRDDLREQSVDNEINANLMFNPMNARRK